MKYLVLIFFFFTSTNAYSDAQKKLRNSFFNYNTKKDLNDWKLKEIGSSLRQGQQCGILFETRLTGNNKKNFLKITMKNVSKKSLVIKMNELSIEFENGRRILPNSSRKEEKLNPKDYKLSFIHLYEKKYFKDQNRITLNLPVYDEYEAESSTCKIVFNIERNKSIPFEESTSKSFTRFDFAVGMGVVTYNRSRALYHNGAFSGVFEFNYYFHGNNQFNASYMKTNLRDALGVQIASNKGWKSVREEETILNLGYSYNLHLTESNYFVFGIGGVYQRLTGYALPQRKMEDISSEFTYFGKFGFEQILLLPFNNNTANEFSIGINSWYRKTPSDLVKNIKTKGDVVFTLLTLRVRL